MISNKVKVELVKITMHGDSISLSDLNEHIQFGVDVLNGEEKFHNYLGCGCEARAYRIKEGFVLKKYHSKSDMNRTISLYSSLGNVDALDIIAETHAVFEVFREDGREIATFLIQEELRPLYSMSNYNEGYNRDKFYDFLVGVKKLSQYVGVNDSHSGNVGIDVNGNIKYLDYGLFEGFKEDSYEHNLEFVMRDFAIHGWFKMFLKYSEIPMEKTQSINKSSLQKVIDTLSNSYVIASKHPF